MDPVRTRLLRGYGPLAAFAVLFVLMAGLIPSIDTTRAEADPVAAGPAGPGTPGAPGTPGTAGSDDPNGNGNGGTGEPGAPGSTPRAEPGGAGATEGARVGGTGITGECEGRDRQVPGDSYAPPCIEFDGNNGGATHQGVSADSITVSYRVLDERGFQQTLAALAGAEITDTPADVQRTVSALAQYFNERFQFYGRQIDIAFYRGQGSSTDELLGGGQEGALIDADTVREMGAFAELNGASAPFTDALAQRGVIAFGTPYLSREWHMTRRPYNWSVATDCSIVSEIAAELAVKQLLGKPAVWAGGNMANQPRKLAGLSPENPWYQECHDAAIRSIEGAGHDAGAKINYRLDINTMSNQAAGVIARLKSEGATTVLCGCDPIMPVFLTARAHEQSYQPEWIVLGTAGTDLDIVGQLMQPDQWTRAFGVSSLGSPLPQRGSPGYAAYKTVRQDEPAFAVDLIYAQMYMLAVGIHMAGPNLTPQTFEQGMFAYPGGTGRFGTWGFDEQSYTPTRDYRVIYWDPDAISIENNRAGGYQEAFDGQRFPLGQVPRLAGDQQPPVFQR